MAVLAGVALLTMCAGPALAQYPPLPEDAVVVSDTTLVPGQVFTVTSSGWQPDTTVALMLFSHPTDLGTAGVGVDTTFSTEVEIPEDMEAGTHTLEISGTSDAGEPRVEQLTIEVLAVGSDPGDVDTTDGGLALTGTNATAGLALAGVLLLSGGVALLVSRRRRHRLVIDE